MTGAPHALHTFMFGGNPSETPRHGHVKTNNGS